MRDEIEEAIEAAASAGNETVGGAFVKSRAPAAEAIARARNVIRRFLQSLPDESMTVLDLRTELDD